MGQDIIVNGKINNSFKNFCALSHVYFIGGEESCRYVAKIVLVCVIFLIKSKFIKNLTLSKVEELVENEDILFISALLLRIFRIKEVNGLSVEYKYLIFNY